MYRCGHVVCLANEIDPDSRSGNLLCRPLPPASGSNPVVQYTAEQVRVATAQGFIWVYRPSGRSVLWRSRNSLHIFAARVPTAALDAGVALAKSPRRRDHPRSGLYQLGSAEAGL